MKKQTLNFNQLSEEIEVLTHDTAKTIIGGDRGPVSFRVIPMVPDGTGSSGGSSQGVITNYLSNYFGEKVTSSQDAMGNWTISIGGRPPIPLSFQLDEVTIVGDKKDNNVYNYNNSWQQLAGITNPPANSGGGTGAGSGAGAAITGNFDINPSIKDAGSQLVDNSGVAYAISGNVWSGHVQYSVSPNQNGTHNIAITAAITPPKAFDHPYIKGNVIIYQNGVPVGGHSLGLTQYPNGTITPKGTLPADVSIVLPANVHGDVDIEIRIGAYDDTGSSNPGDDKVTIVTVHIPDPPITPPVKQGDKPIPMPRLD